MSRLHDFARDYRFAEGAKNDEILPPEAARDLRGLSAAERQDRHAQLHRHPHLGELLGLGRRIHRRRGQPLRHPRRLSGNRRRGRVRARHRLRHGGLWRGLRRAAAHAMGLRHPSQSRRRADGRARLRGVPDRPHERRIRPGRRRSLPDHDHPGDRRHQKDGRAGRRAHQGDAAGRSARASARRGPRPKSSLALQCGGSDGYSGITANPALGRRRRPAGRARRHGSPGRDAGNLRRRASADAPRGQPRGRREAGRAHPLVGGLHASAMAAR